MSDINEYDSLCPLCGVDNGDMPATDSSGDTLWLCSCCWHDNTVHRGFNYVLTEEGERRLEEVNGEQV